MKRGFTLVEMIISLAIVLVLMLGINYVFSTSARTISAGMAMTSVTREHRGARKVFENDFRAAKQLGKMGQPAIVIHNEMVYAWNTRQDKLADSDQDPSTYTVTDPDDIVMGDTDPASWTAANLPGVYNHRRHRIDRVSFFGVNSITPYTRQTGDQNTYISNLTSGEAWISYGLLRLTDNAAQAGYWKPGARGDATAGVFPDERANHNNFFATQWALGRKIMLLKPLDSLPLNETTFLGPSPANPGATGIQFNNLAWKKQAGTPAQFDRETPPYQTGTQWRVEESRVDLVASTIADMRTAFAAGAFGATWWANADPTTTATGTNRDRRDYQGTDPQATINYLSWANPYINKSGFNTPTTGINHQTREAALLTPIFLRGVSQFIVEFAGDFYDQGPRGASTDPEPLGTIDFVPDAAGDQVRWYGMTRDTNGDAVISPTDVAPLSVMPPSAGTAAVMARFAAPAAQKSTVSNDPMIFAWGPADPNGDPSLTAAGNPNNVRPQLVRITLELIDANGRLENGQRIQYVLQMQ